MAKKIAYRTPQQKEIFAKEESLETVEVADKEMKKKGSEEYPCLLIPENGQRQLCKT